MKRSELYRFQAPIIKTWRNRFEIPPTDNDHITEVEFYVIRNEAYEPYLEHSKNYASLMGIDLRIEYSPYLDSLYFINAPETAQAIIIWMNWDRLKNEVIETLFVGESILSRLSKDNRFWVVLPGNFGSTSASFFEEKLANLGWPRDRQLKAKFSTNSPHNITGGYSRQELDSLAQQMGLVVSNIAAGIRLRSIILDLDNTLYDGVFGEDAENEVFASSEHLKLHKTLKKLRNQGVLLCISTKNSPDDVNRIFESNLLSILKPDDFAIIEAGWESKAISINKILTKLNFGEEFAIFIDDNQRELIEVGGLFPNLICLDGRNEQQIKDTLESWLVFETSQNKNSVELRLADAQSKIARAKMEYQELDTDSILCELNTSIRSLAITTQAHVDRANELFRKTNQFNMTLLRSILHDVDETLIDYNVVLCSLEDSVSDSGIIAALRWQVIEGNLFISEFVISCRALGRGVEKYLFMSMLKSVKKLTSYNCVFIKPTLGPKNLPAHRFLHEYFLKLDNLHQLNNHKLDIETAIWYSKFCE
jgi:FkbH-like protein